MYARKTKNHLPWLALLSGGVGLALRQGLYAAAVDSRGLLAANHPLELTLWALTVISLGYLAWSAWKQKGEAGYEAAFPASLPGGVGQMLAGLGVLGAAVLSQPQTGNLGEVCRVLGFLSGPCLMGAGVFRIQGKKPFFALHLLPCLFLMLYVIDHYRSWSSDPQIMNYVFSLFACLSLMLFAFYNASYDVLICHWRMQTGTGLAVIYLCMVSLAWDAGLPLQLGGIAWAVTGLCEAAPGKKRGEAL